MNVAIFAGVTFLAAAFRGLTGFGYALIAALGLVFLASPVSAIPFILISDLMLTVFLLLDRDHGRVDGRLVRLLLVTGFVGAVCGSLLSARLDDATATRLVAVVIFVAALVALVREPPAWLRHDTFGAVIGFVVGLSLAAFAVGGPLVAAWLLTRSRDRAVIKGTLAVFFGAIDGSSLVGRGAFGALGPDLPHLLMLYTLPTVAGFAAGRSLAGRLSFEVWRRIAGGGLVAIAAVGFAQAAWAFRPAAFR